MKYFSLCALVSLLVIFTVQAHNDEFDASEDFEEQPGMGDAEVHDSQDDVITETAPPKERPTYTPPVASGNTHFTDAFVSESDFKQRWILSQAKKDGADEAISKYDGKWSVEEAVENPLKNDLGLVLKEKAKHHAISAKLTKPFEFSGKPLVVQYEVKFQNGQECGGGYIKLLSQTSNLDLKNFNDKTGYTIMFGPDKCGNDNKLHFIFRHKNPKTGVFEEKHAKKPSGSLDAYFTDKKTHLYTLVVKPDNSFEIYVDQNLVNSGNLLQDVSPAVNPPAEISDPNDKKPQDWDEREKIADPDAKKPEDWDETQPKKILDTSAVKPAGWLDDEPELIPDPNGERPSDWDDDMDGEWEAPQINNPKCEGAAGCGEWKVPEIDNPKYKGKWSAPMIDNPNYKGKWAPRMIANPDFFEDKEPYKMTTIAAIGLELWSMSDDILFDNFIITDSKKVADDWATSSWELKQEQESYSSSASGMLQSVIDATNEHPWLWAVIIVVIVLPIVLLVVCCCMSSSKETEEEAVARRKKTDEAAPDDEVEEDEDENGEVEGEGEEDEVNQDDNGSPRRKTTEHVEKVIKKSTKAALETPANEDQHGDSSPRKNKPKKDS